MPMERRTLVPDAGEVALEQLIFENSSWCFERRERLAIAQNAGKRRIVNQACSLTRRWPLSRATNLLILRPVPLNYLAELLDPDRLCHVAGERRRLANALIVPEARKYDLTAKQRFVVGSVKLSRSGTAQIVAAARV